MRPDMPWHSEKILVSQNLKKESSPSSYMSVVEDTTCARQRGRRNSCISLKRNRSLILLLLYWYVFFSLNNTGSKMRFETVVMRCLISDCSPSSTTIAKGSINGLTNTRCCMYSFWAPDDGRRNRLKHAERLAEINELCNVVSCWLYLKIHLQCKDP
jgi:hypothetical protein